MRQNYMVDLSGHHSKRKDITCRQTFGARASSWKGRRHGCWLAHEAENKSEGEVNNPLRPLTSKTSLFNCGMEILGKLEKREEDSKKLKPSYERCFVAFTKV